MKPILDLIQQKPLQDILLAGCIYTDEPRNRFSPDSEKLYLDFGDRFIECFADLQQIDIIVRVVTEISFNPVYKVEEYPECVCSLSGMFYYPRHGAEDRITSVDVVVASESDYAEGKVKSIGFGINEESYLFLDPICFDGMQLGKESERHRWVETYLKYDSPWFESSYYEKHWAP
jgi:hypothetical protein